MNQMANPRLVAPYSPSLLRLVCLQADSASAISSCLRNRYATTPTTTPFRRCYATETKLLPPPRSSQTFGKPVKSQVHGSPIPSSPGASTSGNGASNPFSHGRRRSSGADSQKATQLSMFRRFFSTSSNQSTWRGWWNYWTTGSNARNRQLPPLASFLDASTPRQRVLKAANEPRLRCTEFDEHGNVTLVNGEFKKSELTAKYGLLPRDLRKIDSSLLPSILVRPSAVVINLLHLRVLIRHDSVLVFDAYGSTDSYTQSLFMYDLEGKLRNIDARANGSLPYEFRALEAVLLSVTNALESEFEGVREPVVGVLKELEEDIDRDKLRYLLVYSKKLGTFGQTARLVRDALEELLEADDDLTDMYLTSKAKGEAREESEHQEVELLLESYHKVTNEIVQASENLVSSIRNTEEIVKAILDANRNSLMLLELRFSIWTLGLTAGTFVAALYGMNLKNWIEEHDIGFWGVSAVCFVISTVVLALGLTKLRKVQRVSMWGNSSSRQISAGRGGQALHEMLIDERGTSWTGGGGSKGHMQNMHYLQQQLKQHRVVQQNLDKNRKMAEKSQKNLTKREKDSLAQGPLWEKPEEKKGKATSDVNDGVV